MHILIIHQAFAAMDEAGGTRHHEFARELVKDGHRVTILASPVSYLTGKSAAQKSTWCSREQDGELITILRCFTYTALHRSFFHRLLSFFSFMFSSFWIGLGVPAVDIVWGTSPPIFQGVTAWLLARLKGARFLFEVRDLWPAFAIAVSVLRNQVLIRLSEWLERFLYRHADQIMVNSPGFVDHIRARASTNIALIPNGADPEMFRWTGGATLKHQHQLDDKFVVQYSGAHGMSNDLAVVLEAANLLKNSPQIHFMLVGDGKEKDALISRANQLQLENITFLPSVQKKRMAEVLASADACLAILKPLEMYKTTYPNKVFDYMAAAKPVVLVIDGVIRDVVESAGCGIFCPPGDPAKMAESIQWMASHPVESTGMGMAGKEYLAAHFSRQQIAQDLLHLLKVMQNNHG